MKAKCYQCDQEFECDRNDAVFCSGKCRSQWVRDNGQATGKHVPLDNLESKFCEYCGTQFWYNAYAKRAGKRVPRFCSDKCRVGSFRDRQRATREAAGRAQSDRHSWEAFRQKEQVHSAPPPPPREEPKARNAQSSKGTYWDNLTIPRRWTEMDACTWLNVPYGSSKESIQRQYRTLVNEMHPDKNGGKTSEALKSINAAYDYLKRAWKRSSRQ